MKKLAKILFCLAISATLIGSVNAQNAVKNWMFGQGAKISFLSGSPVASAGAAINTSEGSSSISDSNGNLLFYTDGVTVWDKNNNVMPNGTGLTGNGSSTQSALIVPCNCNKYFIFTTGVNENSYSSGFRYSVVDMSLNGSLGAVTSTKNVLLMSPSIASEKVTGVSDQNGGFWVVAHDMTNRFFSYHIQGGSDCTINPQSAVISAVGTNYNTNNLHGIGQMKLSPDGKRLAAALYQNAVELFQFDINTGMVGFLAKDTFNAGFYGVEFSPNSQFLYATGYSLNTLYRYNITGNTLPRTTLSTFTGNGGSGLQLGPDGKIYIARFGNSFVNVISAPDTTGTPITTFNLAVGSSSRHGFPTMLAGEFSCGQQGCCDQVKQAPFWTPDLSIAWKAFEVFNVKYPSSPVCSIDIDIRNSSNAQPPNPWSAGGLKVNGVPLGVPSWWKSPYTRIPNGIPNNTVINGLPNFNAAAVNFNLGLDYSGTYTGKVKFIIRHCDGSVCEWVSENWTPTPPTQFRLNVRETYLSDLSAQYLPLVLELREGIDIKGEAKWLAVEAMDGDTEIFSVDGGGREFDSSETSDRPQLVVASSRKQGNAALYEFVQTVNLERFESREIKLVLKRLSGGSNKPRLRFIFFDENANIIGFATNEGGK